MSPLPPAVREDRLVTARAHQRHQGRFPYCGAFQFTRIRRWRLLLHVALRSFFPCVRVYASPFSGALCLTRWATVLACFTPGGTLSRSYSHTMRLRMPKRSTTWYCFISSRSCIKVGGCAGQRLLSSLTFPAVSSVSRLRDTTPASTLPRLGNKGQRVTSWLFALFAQVSRRAA